MDDLQLSLTLGLNDAFVGGGTYFAVRTRRGLP